MIEKVAMALHERDQAKETPIYRIPWNACVARYQEELRGEARAAIEAMRTPTPEMFAAFVDGDGNWSDVIDAALSPAPSNTPTVDHANHTGSAE